MMNDFALFHEFAAEGELQFPNLLNDKDFAYYNWTLPFCAM